MIGSRISPAALVTFRNGLKPFVTFNEEEWAAFVPHLRYDVIKKKNHFAVDGKVCEEIGFILTGLMRYYHIKDGVEITGYFSFENEYVTAFKSYITQQANANYIQALQDTALILISYKNMEIMLNDPILAYKMERFGRLIAQHTICCYEDRISSFITQTPEERYLKMIENDRQILQRVPQHCIANFLGITPVSLSRIRRRTLTKI